MRKGLLVVLSGPSGIGKGTLCGLLRERLSLLHLSISMTTRKPRPGEYNGVHYYFVNDEEFKRRIKDNQFLEWAQVYSHLYGTPRDKVQQKIDAGIDVLLEIDTQGGLQVKDALPEAVLVFLLPPSLEELKKRITGRGTEKNKELQQRLKAACFEIGEGEKYDYLVINDNLDEALKKVISIISAEKCRTKIARHLLKKYIDQEDIT